MTETGRLAISVIVPVWNRPDEIRRCLQSLACQSLSKDQYEVIVVDNGSSDDTAEVARSCGVTVLGEPQPGSYAARNRGLAAARGEYIAFIDSDCTAHEIWLEQGLNALQRNPGVGVVAGRIDLVSEPEPASIVCNAYERIFGFRVDRNVKLGRAATANWFSPAVLLREFGGFRSDLKSGGDWELAGRIHDAGYRFEYAADALVYHPVRSSFADLVGKARRVAGGRLASAQPFRRNPVGWWCSFGKDAARRLMTIYRSGGLGIWLKLRLSMLVLTLFGVKSFEAALICLGGQPRRD